MPRNRVGDMGMVTDAGGNVGDALLLSNVASKGKRGGRTAPFAGVLRDALVALKASETASMDRNFDANSGGQ